MTTSYLSKYFFVLEIPFSKIEQFLSECQLSASRALSTLSLKQELIADFKRLTNWQKSGYYGEMKFMSRDPDLFVDVEHFLQNARSVISFFANYHGTSRVELKPGWGRVARYAWGEDYHHVLKDRARNFISRVADFLGVKKSDICSRIFTDAVPFLERALARESKLGFIGKNTMLITPRIGSFTFLGEIFWNIDIVEDGSYLDFTNRGKARCGTCSRCLSACPTDAFVSPYVLDARKCISYLTIEKKTAFSLKEAKSIGDWIFGCDICQDVCPFNHQGNLPSLIAEFGSANGASEALELKSILEIDSQQQFKRRFANTALSRAGRDALLRNALAVASNTSCHFLIPDIMRVYREDPSPLVRSQAGASLEILKHEATGLDRLKIVLKN